MVALNSKGEVVSVAEADQFQPAKSQFECGYFACAIARSMAKPGDAPTLNVQQIIEKAEQWYAQYDGNDNASNTAGMTNEQEYELLKQIGLHFQAIDPDTNQVKAWVKWGYPCLIAITETSVHDLALDGANPYPWTPTGTHIVLVTGIGADGNVLVRDSANVTRLSDPHSLRPGPRMYDAGKLQLVSATVVVPPWRPRPDSATAIPTADLQVPDGWQDDMPSGMLKASNGIDIAEPFRTFILAHNWNGSDVPLAPEQAADPVEIGFQDADHAGKRLITMYNELCWTQSRGVYRASVGRELSIALASRTAQVESTAKQEIMAAARLIGDTATHLITQVAQL